MSKLETIRPNVGHDELAGAVRAGHPPPGYREMISKVPDAGFSLE